MVVLFQQYTEKICFFSKFSAGGLCDWGILLVISLEFQGNKASTVFYDTAFRIVPLPQGRRTFSIKKRGIKMAVFSPHCGDKTTINDNGAFLFINRKLEQSHKNCPPPAGKASFAE